MTAPALPPGLIEDLERDEGLRLAAYQDSGGVWTIGYGHTGKDVHPGLLWDQPQCAAALQADAEGACGLLDHELAWWRSLDDVRQAALANMAFNLGVGGVLTFKHMLAALQAGDFAMASGLTLTSRWAGQVGPRAARIAHMIRTGSR